MGNFFSTLWTALLGTLWPLGRRAQWWPAFCWTLHILLVILIVLGLGAVNRRYPLSDWFGNRFLISYFWPLLFLLLYFITLCGWWLWKLLAFEQESSYFPDLDAAWQEGMYALAQAGIRLPEVPLFLIVGRPETGERNFFESARLNLVVKQTPQDPRAPLHVYADRDAVYVTCIGASLLGRLAGILALEEMGQDPTTEGASEAEIDITKTLIPTKKESQIVEELDESEFGELTTLERRRLRRHIGKSLGPDFMSDPLEVRRLKERLAHLCRLIVRDRQPFCPINGVLLLVPLGGADTDVDAQQTSEACRIDLDTIQSTFEMHFPVLTMLCDMEVLPGFRELIRRQDANNLLRRLGQRFPLATNLPLNEALEKMRQSILWLCNGFIQESIYKYFQIEVAENGDAHTTSIPPGNWALFLLLDEMRSRANRLAAIITQTFGRHEAGPIMFGGCYLGATGNRGEQAFVHGLFDRMIKEQNCVTWTGRALEKDAALHSQTRFGFTLLTLAWLVIPVAIGALLWWKWRGY